MMKILKLISFVLVGLFCISIFRNIQYPLLWNDEAETALYAKTILKFGYPKIHDGKNVIYQAQLIRGKLITQESIDGHIEHDWLMYYFAVPFVAFTANWNDLYAGTGLLRLPFALTGFIGVLLFGYTISSLFADRLHKRLSFVVFLIFEILSIPLALHIREMRYYSLAIFITSLWLFIYIRYYILKNLSKGLFVLGFLLTSILMLVTYRPVFLVFVIFSLSHAAYIVVQEYKKTKKLNYEFLKSQASFYIPLAIIALPYFFFFRVFYYAAEQSKYYNFNFNLYIDHIIHIFRYLWNYEFFSLVAFYKITSIVLIDMGKITGKLKKIISASTLLSFFLLTYVLLTARVPYFMFTRFSIPLQPIMIGILILDLFIIIKTIQQKKKSSQKTILGFVGIVTSIMLGMGLAHNYPLYEGRIYELTHRYQGVLDFVILYIKDKFPLPENLVIATNYEEQAYMYYLDSKTTIGYVGNNLKEDSQIQPDIIILRYGWYSDSAPFANFLEKEKYIPVSFPVANYPVNNIPEFNFSIQHLFKTKLPTDSSNQMIIFIRSKLLEKN